MKIKYISSALMLTAVLSACSRPSNPNPPDEKKISSTDSIKSSDTMKVDKDNQATILNDFATKAAIGGMMEVESSADMIKTTENPDVESLASIMVKDHGAANLELAAIAKKEGIRLPMGLTKEKIVTKNKMDAIKDEDEKNLFYVNLMVKEHQEAIALFSTASAKEGNTALKAFAKKKLPILKHHLMEVQHVQHTLQLIKNDKGDLPLKESKGRQPNP